MAAIELENTSWKLAAYADAAEMREPPDGAEVTLAFQGGAAGGKSACNRYRGDVTVGDETLTFGQIVATRMACEASLMALEDRYLRALASVAAWRVSDGHLALRDSSGQTLLDFTRA